jgi:hypothetical protein
MKRHAILTAIGLVFWLGGDAHAATRYVRQGAAGARTGADWANAYTDLPATLNRGDVYYVAAGNYATHNFNDAASGTATIVIKGATAADHGTDAGWSASFAVGPDTGLQAVWNTTTSGVIIWVSKPYYVFDGNTPGGCDPTHKCGFKLDMPAANCVPSTCYSFYLDGDGSANNITVQYTEMPGFGQQSTHDHEAIRGNGMAGSGTIGPVTIRYNYLHDFGYGGPLQSRQWQGTSIAEFNYIEKNFSSTVNAHSEAWSDCGSAVIFRYNKLWDACFGTGCIVSLNSGATCTDAGWEIYGNQFGITDGNPNQAPGSDDVGGDGLIACINGNVCNGWKIYNNTFYNFQAGWALTSRIGNEGSGTGWVVENNIWYCAANCVGATHLLGGGGGAADYNGYSSGIVHGSEAHAQTITANPFVSTAAKNLRLTAPTTGGLSLAAAYQTDMTGMTRGADGVWDRGAFEFAGVPLPAIPGGVRIIP